MVGLSRQELRQRISASKEITEKKSVKNNKTKIAKMRKCCAKTSVLKGRAVHLNVKKRQQIKHLELNTCLTETHSFLPFVRPHTQIILCGSFLPVRREMNFYYPNTTNDMWRILGVIFFNDCNYFYSSMAHEDKKGHTRKVKSEKKCFDFEKIMTFMESAPIGFCDVAKVIKRKCNNASDDNLEILEEWNIVNDVLTHAPNCKALVATGALSCSHLLRQLPLLEHEVISHNIATAEHSKSELCDNKSNCKLQIAEDAKSNAQEYNSNGDLFFNKSLEVKREKELLYLQSYQYDTESKSEAVRYAQSGTVHVHNNAATVNKVANGTRNMEKKIKLPAIGESVTCYYYRRENWQDKLQTVDVVRAPSTSRAYPLQFVKKLSVYEQIVKQYCRNNDNNVENLVVAIDNKQSYTNLFHSHFALMELLFYFVDHTYIDGIQ